jgi:hypothetical protein
MEIVAPGGERLYVRRVNGRFALGRRRDVYLAAELDGHSPVVSPDLRMALARVVRSADERWLDRATRELEAELPADS